MDLTSGIRSSIDGASVTNCNGALTLTNVGRASQPQGFYRFDIAALREGCGKLYAASACMTDNVLSDGMHTPAPERCRTRYLGQSLDLSDCLVENTEDCKYALRFGLGIVCRHPDRRGFEKPDRQ
jgi:hypothetical protein